MKKYVKGDFEEQHGYSRAVCVSGEGRTVYLAGVGCPFGADGSPLSDDFEAQVRGTVAEIRRLLESLGGRLADLVDATVFLTDLNYSERFVRAWAEMFTGDYPAGTLIEVDALAMPQMLLEVKGVAVIDR